MGYKLKATMYYSDEETEQFLNEHAHKRNGKKSVSHYLYSLVTKEREKATPTRDEPNRFSIQLYQDYIPDIEPLIEFNFEFTSIRNAIASEMAKNKRDKNKKLPYKNIMKEIDKEIKEFIDKNFISRQGSRFCNCSFLVIRAEISLSDFHIDELSEYCKGICEVRCLIIILNQQEHNLFHKQFNSEKIKYHRYEKIINFRRDMIQERHITLKDNITINLCKIAEMKSHDPTGAFFIPARTSPPKKQPQFKPGEITIVGIDFNTNNRNKYRLKTKLANETQIKNFVIKNSDN